MDLKGRFDDWAGSSGLTYRAEDDVLEACRAGRLSASMCGDNSTRRGFAGLQGRYLLMREDDPTSTERGLEWLRRSGDEKSTASAAVRLWQYGPMAPLRTASEAAAQLGWARSTADTSLTLLRFGGDLLREDWAGRAVDGVLDLTGEDLKKVFPWTRDFSIQEKRLRALKGLLPAAPDESHERVAAFVRAGPLNDDRTTGAWAAVVRELRVDALSDATLTSLLTVCRSTGESVAGRAVLRLMADRDAGSVELLREWSAAGSLDAFSILQSIGRPAHEHAQNHMDAFVDRAKATLSKNRSGEWSLGGPIPAEIIAWLSIHYPPIARWDIVIETLAEPSIDARDKYEILTRIQPHRGDLPDELMDLVRERHRIDTAKNVSSVLGEGRVAMGSQLAYCWGLLDESDAALLVAEMLGGDDELRVQLAHLLADRVDGVETGLLIALANDSSGRVRAAAARALAQRHSDSTDAQTRQTLDWLARSDGASIPLALLSGSQQAHGTGGSNPWVDLLLDHPSAIVRRGAEALVS